jgi:hypothetical protein
MADKWIVKYTVEYENPDNIENHIAAISGMQGLTLTNVSVTFDKSFPEV